MYVGLEGIPAVNAVKDVVEYQEGQLLYIVESELNLVTFNSPVHKHVYQKLYKDAMFSIGGGNDSVCTLERRNNGMFYGIFSQ
jgi:hypothetical protein